MAMNKSNERKISKCTASEGYMRRNRFLIKIQLDCFFRDFALKNPVTKRNNSTPKKPDLNTSG